MRSNVLDDGWGIKIEKAVSRIQRKLNNESKKAVKKTPAKKTAQKKK